MYNLPLPCEDNKGVKIRLSTSFLKSVFKNGSVFFFFFFFFFLEKNCFPVRRGELNEVFFEVFL